MADQRTPTPGEIVIMASGVVALIFSFFDFFGSDFGGGRSAWGSGFFPIATLMVIFVVVMAAQIALTKLAGVALPDLPAGFTWEQVHLALGFFAALYALAWLIVDAGLLDRKVGFWLIFVSCIAAFVGAILLQRERAAAGPGRPGGGPTV